MRPVRAFALAALAVGVGACELEEVTLVESRDVVVAEVYVEVVPGQSGRDRVTAFLHRTLATDDPVSRPVPGARIRILRSDGLTLELVEVSIEQCVVNTPVEGTGTCYVAPPETAARVEPRDSLDLLIQLPDGAELRSTVVVPGAFDLTMAPLEAFCTVPPLTPLDVVWTAAEGTWAYIDETLISGLRKALEPRGIPVTQDPLYLLGLSVSAQDTTIVFPGEFGIFDRFDLDQGLTLALQEGLPEGTDARVTITAAERNYVNWVRGGNFNPSGTVRLPSIRGEGTGVFGATVSESFHVFAGAAGIEGVPPCGPGAVAGRR